MVHGEAFKACLDLHFASLSSSLAIYQLPLCLWCPRLLVRACRMLGPCQWFSYGYHGMKSALKWADMGLFEAYLAIHNPLKHEYYFCPDAVNTADSQPSLFLLQQNQPNNLKITYQNADTTNKLSANDRHRIPAALSLPSSKLLPLPLKPGQAGQQMKSAVRLQRQCKTGDTRGGTRQSSKSSGSATEAVTLCPEARLRTRFRTA